MPEGRLNDLELTSGENLLWQKSIQNNDGPYFGIRNKVITKIKITVFFWYEGWDSDCLNFINFKTTSLNLAFSVDL